MRQAGLNLLPPIMIASRTETRRVTVSGSGRRGGPGCPCACPAQPEPGFWRDGGRQESGVRTPPDMMRAAGRPAEA